MELRQSLSGSEAWKLGAIILLMFVNWGLETRKWQVLLRHLHKISFWQAFKAILSGLAFALNTPNRIGEYGGRVLFIPEGKRVRAVSLTLAGSFSQLLVTLLLGSFGLFVLSGRIIASAEFSSLQIWITALQVLVIFITLIGFIIYFKLSWLVRVIEKIPGIQSYTRHIAVLEDMHVRLLLHVLLLSLLQVLCFYHTVQPHAANDAGGNGMVEWFLDGICIIPVAGNFANNCLAGTWPALGVQYNAFWTFQR